ncbi:MAG: hypothetical protein KAT71_08285 [Gammaproteobacteria bacterium]|nr:hypothetical protein [Gammaproteobacteria bacterium]
MLETILDYETNLQLIVKYSVEDASFDHGMGLETDSVINIEHIDYIVYIDDVDYDITLAMQGKDTHDMFVEWCKEEIQASNDGFSVGPDVGMKTNVRACLPIAPYPSINTLRKWWTLSKPKV